MNAGVKRAAGLLAGAVAGTAGVLATPRPPVAPEPLERVGILNGIWNCGPGENGAEPALEYRLWVGRGTSLPLRLPQAAESEAPDLLKLLGRRVLVRGVRDGGALGEEPGLEVRFLQAAGDDSPAEAPLVRGERSSRPYLTLLLKFADTAGKTPRPRSYFEQLMGPTEPSLGGVFTSLSYGRIDLRGSRVMGWLTLPRTRRAYFKGDGAFNFARVLEDAVTAAGASHTVDRFAGINLMFNMRAFGDVAAGYGGKATLEVNGKPQTFGVTWLAYADQAVWVHEMGHSMGMPHSSGPYRKTYDSRWDVMSQSYLDKDERYGYVAQSTIAHHRELAGWVTADEKCVIPRGEQHAVTLETLNVPAPAGEYQMVVAPVDPSSRQYYTAEARQQAGCDRVIPGSGVVLHQVDTFRGDRQAQVVDQDRNGNPNDGGARWLPGEVMDDLRSNIQVWVVGRAGRGYRIRVSNGVLAPTHLRARSLARGQVKLSWVDHSRDERYYAVERRAPGSGWAEVARLGVNAVSFTDSALPPSVRFTYRVRITNALMSGYSNGAAVVPAGRGAGRLQAPASVHFARVRRSEAAARVVAVRNRSRTEALTLRARQPGGPFQVAGPEEVSVPPLGTARLPVTFAPESAGTAAGVLELETSDPARPVARIRLRGRGTD